VKLLFEAFFFHKYFEVEIVLEPSEIVQIQVQTQKIVSIRLK